MRPLLLALLLLAAPAQAQDSASASTEALEAALGRATTRTPQDLGLQQSLERALADNLGLRAKLRELEAASFRAKAAIQPWLPILSASGTAHPFKTERFSDQFQAWQRSEGDDANYSVGLAAALPVGTSVNLGWSQGTFNQLLTWEPLDPDSLEAQFLEDNETHTRWSAFSFTLNQSLLKGISPTWHLQTLWQAEIAVDSAEVQRDKEMTTVLANTLKAYWDLVAATQNVAIAQEGRTLAESQREVTQARIAAGDLAPIELLRIDETVATRSSEVLQAEQAVEEAEGRLKMVLGIPLDDELGYARIVPTDGVDLPIPERTHDGSLQIALHGNLDLALARANLESREIQWAADKHGRLPTLDLNTSLTLNGSGQTTQESVSDVFARKFPDFRVGLTLAVPLPDLASWHGARASGADVEAALLNLQQAEREVLAGIEGALLQIRSFDKQVEVAQIRIDLAEQTAAASEATYAVGRNTLRDVLEAQQALKSARQARVSAEVEALKSRVDLEVLRGSLLETLGVELE